MDSKQKNLWKRLNVNLDMLTVADASAIAPLILEIQSFILNEDFSKHSNKLNFMVYELVSRCQNLNELDRKALLTDYFFNEKGFLINHLSKNSIETKDWFLSNVLDTGQGTSFIMSLLYIHFAQCLEIPIYLINTDEDNILKWVIGSSPVYLDITLSAAKMSNKKMCELLVNMNSKNEKIPADCFDILPTKYIVKKYLDYLANIYSIKKETHLLKTTLDVLIKIEPANLNYIRKRALACKALNLNKQAIEDIRKYFSLNGENEAPKELKLAYYELRNLTTPRSTLLH